MSKEFRVQATRAFTVPWSRPVIHLITPAPVFKQNKGKIRKSKSKLKGKIQTRISPIKQTFVFVPLRKNLYSLDFFGDWIRFSEGDHLLEEIGQFEEPGAVREH